MNDEIYFPEPLGSFCDVAVFPPIEYPSIYAFVPPPSETTPSRICFIISLVCDDIASSSVEYANSLTTEPSDELVYKPKCGVTSFPPLTIAATALNICTGVIWNDCPNDIVASSTAPTFSFLWIIVPASPERSIPVFARSPSLPMYRYILSVPTLLPHSTNAGLHELYTVCVKSCVPCPVVLWHLILLSDTTVAPEHVKESFNPTTPVSSAAVAVTVLNIEPGSYVSLMQKFRHILLRRSILSFCASSSSGS